MTTWIFITSEISYLITYLSLSFQHSSSFLYCGFFGCLLLLFPLSFLLDSLESFFLFLQAEYVLIYCWQEGTPGISTAGKPQHETGYMWLWQKNAEPIHKHTNKFIKTRHKIPIQMQQVDKTVSAVGDKIKTKNCTAQAECWKESLAMFYITSVGIENKKCVHINPLTPNDHYSGRTAPLTSKRCILYIYSTNIGTEYFKHGIYSPGSLSPRHGASSGCG